MILVHAGNRVDAPDREGPARFPETQVEYVRSRLSRLLELVRPTTVVSAPAAGADLVILDEALRLRLPVHVVLPFERARFLTQSVADRGDSWAQAFDRVLTAVSRSDTGRVVERGEAGDEASLRAGNTHLLDHAAAIADGEGILALAVRPGDGENPPSITDDFVDQARARGLTVIDIDPRLRSDDMDRAVVAVPFGADAFTKLVGPALEDADLLWERAEVRLDRGRIASLGDADVVVLDMSSVERFPAFDEAGLGDALTGRMTVVIGPEGSPRLDTGSMRTVHYRMTDGAIDDASALTAIDRLRRVLAEVCGQRSP